MQDSDHRKQIIAGLAVIVIIAVIVVATMSASKKTPTASVEVSPTTEAIAEATAAPVAADTATPAAAVKAAQAYKDGSYTATGSYSSPGGNEAIAVTVTLKNGVISDTTAQSKANDSDSAEYQAKFISGYKSLVVGKSIDTVSLSRVSGSSLTSKGFNSAITAIKAQAKT